MKGVVFTDVLDNGIIVKVEGIIYIGIGGERNSEFQRDRKRKVQVIR